MHNRHDKLFKLAFRNPVNTAAFLRTQLPPKLIESIDWGKLTLNTGSFVDVQLKGSETDLLFTAPFLNYPGTVAPYLLFEHQSTKDAVIALRILRYMVNIWEKLLKENPSSPLPIIIPIVLAQDSKEWKIIPQFRKLLDLPADLDAELHSYIPNFSFCLIELAALPYGEILGTPEGMLVLRTLKAERLGELDKPEVWAPLLIADVARSLGLPWIH